MTAIRSTLSKEGCSHCRAAVLSLFAKSHLQYASVVRSLPSIRHRVVSPVPVRLFSSVLKPSNSISETGQGQDTPLSGKHPQDHNETVVTESTSDVPWYLQVEPPAQVAPMEPAPLPEIPPDAPPFIGSLLTYISEDMGLDALTLLDLRKLEPPPALGPNLFMLFGTARSERHLNVSAGRLVRWLRAKHKIHADADGLLGPNERKTKLRRQVRRAKLLGTMGTDEGDDGIRTGWVCVNLGTVDQGGPESAVIAEDGRVSGFGVSRSGCTIVVQVMTASRRAEMELETLWTGALERSTPPPALAAPEEEAERPRTGRQRRSNLHSVEETMLANLHRPSALPDARSKKALGVSRPNQARSYTTEQRPTDPIANVDTLDTALHRLVSCDAHQKQRLLGLLKAHLNGMDPQAAHALFRVESFVNQLPAFFELMELAMQTLPPTHTWVDRLAVYYKLSVLDIVEPSQLLPNVRALIEDLRLYGIQATRDQYLHLISCILYSTSTHGRWDMGFELAFHVIKTMDQRGQNIMANDVIVTIIEGVSRTSHDGSKNDLVGKDFTQLLFRQRVPYMGEKLLMRLITVHANRNHWDDVWSAWSIPPRYLKPRSAHLYSHMFKTAVASGSSAICTMVIRRCLPEMLSEKPCVSLRGDMQALVLKCIRVADPAALLYARKVANSPDSRWKWGVNSEMVNVIRMMKSAS
ncbi:hypothetical protein GGS20DRAFT_573311 [Poronia punctata]|nr:hypothetical protein GGS20DRAFT_573311 [Poronia punctata]